MSEHRVPDGTAEQAVSLRMVRFADLTPRQLYGILRLRVDVFVVEQESAYADLDGRDAEPDAWHLFAERDEEVLAAVRLLAEPEGRRIGRVVTRAAWRGRGLAGRLVATALEHCRGQSVAVNAQRHLEHWYAGFGFVRSGPDYDDDGILHLPMRRG